MRIAVISDIHGNCVALDAVLTEIRTSEVDRIVCLGDAIQGGPQPKETVERLRSIGCPIVMGNSDDWLIKEESDFREPTSQEVRDVRKWTISKLNSTDLAHLRSYQSTVKIPLDSDITLLCFHGSPLSYDDVLLPDTPKEDWDKLLGPFSPAIMTGGHTHMQQMRRVREGLFFNPGSVGFAYDSFLPPGKMELDPWAEYVILSYDRKRLHVEFRRAPFDEKLLIKIIGESGRPHSHRYINEYKAASSAAP